MKKLIHAAIHRRALMFVLFGMLGVLGYLSWRGLAIDAYPDIADVTVQVVTQVPGLAAEEIEQQISIPIERAMNGLPGLNVMRSKNTFGLSTVVLAFNTTAWTNILPGPATGCRSALPMSNCRTICRSGTAIRSTSPTGEIFRYVLESKTHDLRELTDLHKWVVIPRLRQVTGVADVSNYGGITTQYQIEIDPRKMEQYGISLSRTSPRRSKRTTSTPAAVSSRAAIWVTGAGRHRADQGARGPRQYRRKDGRRRAGLPQ